ncbi:MAG: DNA-directed RNA polymerase subunit beta' [Parcubacteria group bacterium GW2011_GWB1_41_6]|nr:MAG: DNA-directed RNA polymerase subunit beta' [Parcubacteria group bacterium GW2011_GWB1_41_6]KKS34505.1 MAG: DNA-directed RNA polymerase subunit beta' [Parcubacteria group bacterium GW2011_GWC2_42_13]KKS57898.1 MAG: DNA-directed RNA polymerase subunit beta' [Parcubacteria group bacterium GW2011_GWA2_42_35]
MDRKTTDFQSITVKLASPEKILSWSYGEVTKPETINYRTQRPERDGLFDERIFGPQKDYECYCGKYRRIRYKGVVCEKCGVEVTRSIVRRERMGHIQLASPVSHIWFLRGIPSKIGLILNLSVSDLEKVIYFAGYIVIKVNEKAKMEIFKQLEKEYGSKIKTAGVHEKEVLKEARNQAKKEVEGLTLFKVLNEVEYHRLSLKYGEIFEAGIGAEALYEICKGIDLNALESEINAVLHQKINPQERIKALKRLNLIRSLLRSGVRPEWMFLTVIPIIPPDLRPMVQLDGGRHATSDVNDLYRRVINRNNRLKKLTDLKAPEVIMRNEKRMLQEAIDALIDNAVRKNRAALTSQAQRRPLRSLADLLKGKQGRFRQNLLGKRVDYSGRSVIVVGAHLKLHQCGLPKHMALELFRPFVVSLLIDKGLAHNIRGSNHLIDEAGDEVWAILEEVIKDKYVLLNRAPTLHRLGIQAFQPLLIEGTAIQVHPLVCSAFNADFDGDQMAVHLPLTKEAQNEAKNIMASNLNLLKPGTGEPIVNPSQDIILGCYWLTKMIQGVKGEGRIFSSPNEAVLAHEFNQVDLQARIKVKKTNNPKYKIFKDDLIETTVGRLLFNGVLPGDFEFVNEELKKGDLNRIVERLISRYQAETPAILDKIKDFGFRYATKSGISWGIDDVVEPKAKPEIIRRAVEEASKIQKLYDDGLLNNNERYERVVQIWRETKQKVDALVQHSLDPLGSVHNIVSSAARGSWNQINQIAGMKGSVRNPAGQIIELPILNSYKAGLTVLEYFISTHGARKGLTDTALKTAAAGYLTRRLVDVAQDVIVSEKDCGVSKGFFVSRSQIQEYGKKSFARRLVGRTLSKNIKDKEGNILFKKNHLLNLEDAEKIEAAGIEEAEIRSPIACQSTWGVCQLCYGYDLGKNKLVELGQAVGIVAAQAIGEPGTQLTMRTFHTGGIATGGDITLGLPRVEEIFELRIPRNLAVLSSVDGKVIDIQEGKRREKIIKVESEEGETLTFSVPFGRTILAQKGEKVKKGGSLSGGFADLKELYDLAGEKPVQDYILKEVSAIYTFQGSPINEKHIEVIIRQMFNRFKVTDPGDTSLSPGKVVDPLTLKEENQIALNQKLKEAKTVRLLMGISKVALTTSSFLSAASFQDTARVLIAAACEGREDKLRGLKENVIIGRLIPAGTAWSGKPSEQ